MAEKNELPADKGINASERAVDESKSSSSGDTAIAVNRNWQDGAAFFRWFHPDDSAAERRVILKLDLSILAFACAGFWVGEIEPFKTYRH